MSSLVPHAAALLGRRHPGLAVTLTDTHPDDALDQLRAGDVDIAVIFRHDDTTHEDGDVRLTHVLDDPLFLLSTGGARHRRTPDRSS